MGSDVDLAVLCDSAEGYLADGAWFCQLRPGADSSDRPPGGQSRRGGPAHIPDPLEFGFAPLPRAPGAIGTTLAAS